MIYYPLTPLENFQASQFPFLDHTAMVSLQNNESSGCLKFCSTTIFTGIVTSVSQKMVWARGCLHRRRILAQRQSGPHAHIVLPVRLPGPRLPVASCAVRQKQQIGRCSLSLSLLVQDLQILGLFGGTRRENHASLGEKFAVWA